MGKKSPGRKALNQRLLSYSATAGAAMLCAPGAHAAVTTITSFTIVGGNSPANPPAISFSFGHANASFSAGPFLLSFSGVQHHSFGTAARGYFHNKQSASFQHRSSGIDLARLAPGAAIEGGFFIATAQPFFKSHDNLGITVHSGQFLPVGGNAFATGYIGLKGAKNGNTYYGWLRLQVRNNSSGFPSQMKLVAAAGHPGVYGAFDLSADVAGDGFTAGSVAAVPEPSAAALGGLALLALGAAGVREMRRRRQAAAFPES